MLSCEFDKSVLKHTYLILKKHSYTYTYMYIMCVAQHTFPLSLAGSVSDTYDSFQACSECRFLAATVPASVRPYIGSLQ